MALIDACTGMDQGHPELHYLARTRIKFQAAPTYAESASIIFSYF